MPERGELTVLCLHEAGTSGAIWGALSDALSDHAAVLAPDRPGWGENEAPEGYERTTITEQAGFAVAMLRGSGPAVVCGSGIGAVAAIELSLAEPGLVVGTALIEPPLLSYAPEATGQFTLDVATVRDAVAAGGREAALSAYLTGGLPALGPGASRMRRATGSYEAKRGASISSTCTGCPFASFAMTSRSRTSSSLMRTGRTRWRSRITTSSKYWLSLRRSANSSSDLIMI